MNQDLDGYMAELAAASARLHGLSVRNLYGEYRELVRCRLDCAWDHLRVEIGPNVDGEICLSFDRDFGPDDGWVQGVGIEARLPPDTAVRLSLAANAPQSAQPDPELMSAQSFFDHADSFFARPIGDVVPDRVVVYD